MLCQKPAPLDEKISTLARKILYISTFGHMIVAIYVFGNQQLINYNVSSYSNSNFKIPHAKTLETFLNRMFFSP